MDGRLAMCALAVGVAMFALLWDYLYPFPASKYVFGFVSYNASYTPLNLQAYSYILC